MDKAPIQKKFAETNIILDPEKGIKQELHRLLCGHKKTAWNMANVQEFFHLNQGVNNDGEGGTNTIHFIP